MRLKYKGDGKVLIQGIAHEFHNGDIIDLPDKVAKNILENNRFFEEVKEKPIKSKTIRVGG